MGVALATKTDSMTVAFLLGFLSHFILDAIPHLDPGTILNIPEKKDQPWPAWVYIVSFAELFVTLMLFYFLFHDRVNFVIMGIGALGGLTVDILDNNPFRFLRNWPVLKQLHVIHEKIHFSLKPKHWYLGIPSEIIVLGGTIWYLLKF